MKWFTLKQRFPQENEQCLVIARGKGMATDGKKSFSVKYGPACVKTWFTYEPYLCENGGFIDGFACGDLPWPEVEILYWAPISLPQNIELDGYGISKMMKEAA